MIPQKPEILKAPLVVNGEKNILPETTPQGSNLFSLLGGFPTLTSLPVNAGGLPPKRLDFNAVFNLLSIHTFFLQSGNKYSWSSELDYSIGSTVLGSDNSVYFCIKANGATPPNTVQNPVTSTGYWVELVNSNGTVNIDLIADGAISTNKIANGAINTSKLADNAVTSAKIANGAINTSKLADNAVTSAKIADGTIVNADIANATITGAKLVNNTITATQLANNAVINAKIVDGAVTSAKILDGTIVNADIANATITGAKLANNTITATQLANNAVINAKIVDGAVNDAKILGVSASKVTGLATVAKTGSYNDLTNKPAIPTNAAPMPTNNSGVGNIFFEFNYGAVTLPSGGSWLTINAGGNNSGDFFGIDNYDIYAGGTQLPLSAGQGFKQICAWRIQ